MVEEAEEAAGGEVMVPEAGAWLRKSGNMATMLFCMPTSLVNNTHQPSGACCLLPVISFCLVLPS